MFGFGYGNEVLKLRVLTGVSTGTEVFIPKMTMTPTDHKSGFHSKEDSFQLFMLSV